MFHSAARRRKTERAISPAKLAARARGAKGKFRLTRGPLRWWLIIAGLLTVQFDPARYAIGTVLVLVGATIHFLSKCYLRQAKSFIQQERALTTAGPYRFTRNPFYLANLIAESGLLVIIGRLWVAIPFLFVWAWVYWKTIRAEEAKLAGLLGEDYARYLKAVPRLFPVPWRMMPRGAVRGPQFSWKNPNIFKGQEIERALRLLSYPALLYGAAKIHLGGMTAFLGLHGSEIAALGAVLLVNTCVGPLIKRLHRPNRTDEAHAANDPLRSGRHLHPVRKSA